MFVLRMIRQCDNRDGKAKYGSDETRWVIKTQGRSVKRLLTCPTVTEKGEDGGRPEYHGKVDDGDGACAFSGVGLQASF